MAWNKKLKLAKKNLLSLKDHENVRVSALSRHHLLLIPLQTRRLENTALICLMRGVTLLV